VQVKLRLLPFKRMFEVGMVDAAVARATPSPP
jgi:hypothetical protein